MLHCVFDKVLKSENGLGWMYWHPLNGNHGMCGVAVRCEFLQKMSGLPVRSMGEYATDLDFHNGIEEMK